MFGILVSTTILLCIVINYVKRFCSLFSPVYTCILSHYHYYLHIFFSRRTRLKCIHFFFYLCSICVSYSKSIDFFFLFYSVEGKKYIFVLHLTSCKKNCSKHWKEIDYKTTLITSEIFTSDLNIFTYKLTNLTIFFHFFHHCSYSLSINPFLPSA